MIEKVLSDKRFIELMGVHCYDVISRLLSLKIEFAIVANTKFCDYEPKLPKDLDPSAKPFVIFVLAGYTFESIELMRDKIVFHAGFGPHDFASFVSVDLGAITQIQVQNDVVFVNFSFYQRENSGKNSNDFQNNPKNKDKFKGVSRAKNENGSKNLANPFSNPQNKDSLK